MSIADKITSMTNHLEKDYQALESVVGTISVNKNIENIAPLLDNLWEDLPKTTGSGTSPSISDTRAGKMKVNLLGNTSQTGTPTPNNPIPVNVVSGDNTIEVSGKNRLNPALLSQVSGYNTYNSTTGLWTTNTGTNTSYNRSIFYDAVGYSLNRDASKIIKVKPSTTYTLKFYDTTNVSYTIGLYTSDGTFITAIENISTTDIKTFSTPNNCERIDIRRQEPNTQLIFSKIMLIEGSYTSETLPTYEPYQSSTYPVNLPVENILNADTPSITIPTNNTSTKSIGTINLVGGTTYYISYTQDKTLTSDTRNTPILEYNGNRVYQYSTSNVNLTAGRKVWEYTPTDTGTYTLEYWCHTPSQEVIFNDFMVSTINASYTPYGTTPIELCKIGTYQDKFIRNDGSNLWSSVWEQGEVSGSNGENYGNLSMIRTKDYIAVKPNTHYAINRSLTGGAINVRCYGADKSYLGTGADYLTLISGTTAGNPMDQTGSQCVIAPKDNVYYLRFNDLTNNLSTLYMMVEGDTQASYQPYGNGDWYLEKELGKVVLDGTQYVSNVNSSSTNTSRVAFYSLFDFVSSDILCDKLIVSSGAWGTDAEAIYFARSGGADQTKGDLYFRINKSLIGTNADTYNAYARQNNITIYMPISPTYTKIEGTLKDELDEVYRAYSYKGQTNINQVNNDLPFELSVTALEG